MKNINTSLAKQRATWKKKLTKANKAKLSKTMVTDITTREAQIRMLQDEVAALKGQKANLDRTKVVVAKKTKKKKKKSDLERSLGKLGIKL